MTENKKTNERKQNIEEFCAKLTNLHKSDQRGDLAALKRAVGTNLGESIDALQVFYKILPYGISSWDEPAYYLVATLFPHNTRSLIANFKEKSKSENFGITMQKIYAKKDSDSIKHRFAAILNSRLEDGSVAHKLRQAVKLADSSEVSVNWPQLLWDLLFWSHEKKFVQKSWAESFFKNQPKE